MKYWRQTTKEEYDIAPSRAIDKRNGRLYIVVNQGGVKEIVSDLIGGLKW